VEALTHLVGSVGGGFGSCHLTLDLLALFAQSRFLADVVVLTLASVCRRQPSRLGHHLSLPLYVLRRVRADLTIRPGLD
jgi:hypothetical protein